MSAEGMSRRSVLGGLLVVAAGSIAGCSGAQSSSAAKAGGSTSTTGASGGGRFLVSLNEIPAQGGVVLAGQKVVLTRDGGDTVHGFSAICTHLGCTVDSVENGTIMCPCHGSRFDAQTGAVRAGPATRPLPAVPVTVRGSGVYES